MNENDDSLPTPAPAIEPAPVSGRARPGLPLQAKLALGLGLAIALALLFWPRAKAERRFEDGYLMDASGAPVALASRLAPATLVHFWATWCPPCRQEIPSLLAFADEVGPERLTLVLVAVADERDRAVEFVGNDRFPVLFDPVWDVARRFRTQQLPESHLILDGKLAATFIGATDWQDARGSVPRRTVLEHLAVRGRRSHRPAAAEPRRAVARDQKWTARPTLAMAKILASLENT